MLDPRSMPDGTNGKMFYGVNQKEYGTTLFATGTGASLGATPVSAIYEAKYPANSALLAFTDTGMYKYVKASDSFTADGQTYTGTYSDCWRAVMHNDAFIYTNGKDLLQYKVSVSATGTAMESAVTPTTYKAYSLSSVRDHLCLYHVFENGSEYFKRVMWSKKGVLTYSAGSTDFGSGVAGAIDLMDCEGEIRDAVPLGVAQAVYSDRSIHVQTWVGGDEVFRFVKTVSGYGLAARRGVLSLGAVNYFIGHNSFYAYYGGDDLRDIGAPISKRAFDEISAENLGNAYVTYDAIYNEVLFHVPTGSSYYPNTVWVYRLENESWSKLDRTYTSAGGFTRQAALTIGELVGDIGAQNYLIGALAAREGAETKLYGDAVGNVVKKDPTVQSICVEGTQAAQPFTWVTPDLAAMGPKGGRGNSDPVNGTEVDFTSTAKRYTQFTVEMYGSGVSYLEFPESPVTLTTEPKVFTLDMDYTSPQMRFKVAQTGLNDPVAVVYAKVEYIPATENQDLRS